MTTLVYSLKPSRRARRTTPGQLRVHTPRVSCIHGGYTVFYQSVFYHIRPTIQCIIHVFKVPTLRIHHDFFLGLGRCTCVSPSARQSRAQCCAREFQLQFFFLGLPVLDYTQKKNFTTKGGRTTRFARQARRGRPQEQSHHSHSGAHPLPTPTSPPSHGNSFSCLLSIAASRGGRQPLSTRRWRPPARPRIRLRVVAHSSQLAVRASAGSAPATRSSI